jgi:hypothetical protein
MHLKFAALQTKIPARAACIKVFLSLAFSHGFRLQGRRVGSRANLEGHGRAVSTVPTKTPIGGRDTLPETFPIEIEAVAREHSVCGSRWV